MLAALRLCFVENVFDVAALSRFELENGRLKSEKHLTGYCVAEG